MLSLVTAQAPALTPIDARTLYSAEFAGVTFHWNGARTVNVHSGYVTDTTDSVPFACFSLDYSMPANRLAFRTSAQDWILSELAAEWEADDAAEREAEREERFAHLSAYSHRADYMPDED